MPAATTTRRVTCRILFGLFFSFFIAGVSFSLAQSLGNVAREERQRRADESRPHVYTNEDLSRSQIVIRTTGAAPQNSEAAESAESNDSAVAAPNDARVETESPSSASTSSASSASSIVWPSSIPLGDIARFYRRQRDLESARDSQFAVYEPPILDMDFLLPSPLASPLADFALPLPALPVPEPEWDPVAMPAGVIRVQRGDTLWKIAARHLGSGEDWSRIAAVNPDLEDPNRIYVGQQIHLPAPAVETPSSENQMRNQVRVQPGDSLWKLAKREMGNGYSWTCLAAANPQVENANRIYPGQLIVIPVPTACRG